MENLDSFLGVEFTPLNSPKSAGADGDWCFDVAYLRRLNGDQVARGTFRNVIELTDRQRDSQLSPLFVSYYTPATPYETLANQLRRSLDRSGLEHRVEPIPSQGSWVANTGLKSAFIERAWRESDRPVCWVDADAELLRPPHFLYGNPFDFAVVRRHGWYFMSGVAYFGRNAVSGQLLSRWAELCRQYPHVWDQVLLTLAWYEIAQIQQINTMYLPDGVFRFPRPFIRDLRDRIFYYPLGKKIRPFFDQKQASRVHKKFIDASRRPDDERSSDDLCVAFKKALVSYNFDEAFNADSIFSD